MKQLTTKVLVTTLLLSPLMANTVWADEAVLEQRIQRLERIIKGQGLVSLLGRVDQLQNEVQRLNGDNESLRHELEAMQRRQREMYLDLDQRLSSSSPVAAPAIVDATVTQTEPTAKTTVTGAPTPVDQTEQVESPPLTSTVEPSPVAVESGEAAYQAALQTLRGGQYEEAIIALAAFPEQYPQSNYLPNTYYWQGEANYVLRNFDLAIKAFQTVIDNYPASSKVADATLKQGFSQYELGQVDNAKATLAVVVEQYPNTSAARLAKVRLDRINKETR